MAYLNILHGRPLITPERVSGLEILDTFTFGLLPSLKVDIKVIFNIRINIVTLILQYVLFIQGVNTLSKMILDRVIQSIIDVFILIQKTHNIREHTYIQ